MGRQLASPGLPGLPARLGPGISSPRPLGLMTGNETALAATSFVDIPHTSVNTPVWPELVSEKGGAGAERGILEFLLLTWRG